MTRNNAYAAIVGRHIDTFTRALYNDGVTDITERWATEEDDVAVVTITVRVPAA